MQKTLLCWGKSQPILPNHSRRVMLGAGCEIERKGTTLGTEPKAFFPAERIESGFPHP